MQEKVKIKIIYFLVFLFITSMSLENLLNFQFLNLIRVSIVEICFLLLSLFSLIFFYDKVFIYIKNLNNFKLFDLILYFTLILKLIKILINPSPINIYELFIWIYMILIFNLFNFLQSYDQKIRDILNFSIVSLSILISFFVIFSLFIYFIFPNFFEFLDIKNYLNNDTLLWTVKEIHYPYYGENSVHFFGFVYGQNKAAFLLIPGYFIFLHLYKLRKLINVSIFIIFISCLLLIKAKILYLVILFTIFYFLFNNNKFKFLFSRGLSLIYLFIIIFIYYVFTHFLILDPETINNINEAKYSYYYTKYPIFETMYFEVYGSLFLKLKLIALNLIYENYLILFSGTNIINYSEILSNYPNGHDISSEYFSLMANYGIILSVPFFYIILYFFYFFTKNFYNKNFISLNLPICIILTIFSIEAMLSEILHFQQLWVLYSIFYISLKTKLR
tara:strand:- start:11664 stop:13001 length:1338 start_codon:yes stop_codon:yes gene_type:complete